MANSNNSIDPVYSYLKAIVLLIVYLASLYEAQAQVHLVKDLEPGSGSSEISSLIVSGNNAWFINKSGVWRTDGTAENTVNIREDMGMTLKGLLKTSNALYFVARVNELNAEKIISSDGFEEPVALHDFNFSSIDWLREVNGAVYFAGSKEGGSGTELWKTNGVIGDVTLVADINPGAAGSFPGLPFIHEGIMYFRANDGTNGTELWRSDGTLMGTTMVKNIAAGNSNSNPQEFASANGKIYFNAQTDVGQELWVSDGTEEGTHIVADINPGSAWANPINLVTLNNIVYFFATDIDHGFELFRSDGTEAGTYLVKDTHPATDNYLESPDQLIVVDGSLYFSASDGEHGVELWKSDGTAEGTRMLKDINEGSRGSALYWFTNIDDHLFFVANSILRRSNGTECSTVPVLDRTSIEFNDTFIPTGAGNKMYFVGTSEDGGSELYFYDFSTVDIGGCEQTITFEDIALKKFGDAPFDLNASSSAGLTITFESSDETIASISGNTVTINAPGEVSITANQNGNIDYKPATPVIQSLSIEMATGLEEDVDKLVSVYPNPTTDFVFVDGKTLGDGALINLIDINGNTLGAPEENTMKLDVSNLPAGIYILRVMTKDFTISKRIIKK